MFRFDSDNKFFVDQSKVLEFALSTNPDTQKVLRQHIRKVIEEARKQLITAAEGAMQSDPRGAAYSIKRTTYKKLLGANINLFATRRAGAPTSYEPPRKLDANPRQVGGNRVARGKRTDTMMHYGPHDRQMVLLWLNTGANDRQAGTKGGKLHGNRGSIAARNWFGRSGQSVMNEAVEKLANLVNNEIEDILDKKR